jgi:Ca2+-binding RTX toxin-like protein
VSRKIRIPAIVTALGALLVFATVALAANLKCTSAGCPPGTPFSDTILGSTGNDTVNADAGNDRVIGRRGNDTLNGEAGNDRLGGNSGGDTLNGGPGSDLLKGYGGIDTLNGGDDVANDRLDGGYGGDALNGGPGDDRLYGGKGPGGDTLNGNAGGDTLNGGRSVDFVYGGDGADHLYGRGDGGRADTLDCGDGGGDDGAVDVVRADKNDTVQNCTLTGPTADIILRPTQGQGPNPNQPNPQG